MRIFFNLTNDHESLADREGLEVPNPQCAPSEILNTLEELRRRNVFLDHDWKGWTLHVVSDAGALLLAVDLGEYDGLVSDLYPANGTALTQH